MSIRDEVIDEMDYSMWDVGTAIDKTLAKVREKILDMGKQIEFLETTLDKKYPEDRKALFELDTMKQWINHKLLAELDGEQ